MINKKEDLIGTYVKTDNDELLNLYIEKCLSFGFYLSPAFSDGKLIGEDFRYAALGIDGDCIWAVSQNYPVMIKELTIGEVKSIPQPKEVEWVNGLPPVGVECECLIDCSGKWKLCEVLFSSKESVVVVKLKSGAELAIDPFSSSFRKQESPEDKAKRDREEAAYDLYLTRHLDMNAPYRYEEFLKNKITLNGFLAIVDKTNYRCTTSS